MLQANDIEHRFHLVQQAIGQAAQACSGEPNLPSELRDSIQRLDRHSDTAQEVVFSRDELRLHKLVREMDRLAERARQVCLNIPRLSPQLRGAVSYMHSQIMELKRDMRISP
ncbi:hypothetical protein [Duganella sp. Dugasp56]|uniref:hypothetical protein n=1 Tax=Duganella sp. Dugasp56 TaxID=3243046 RepID=UPI0039B00C2B